MHILPVCHYLIPSCHLSTIFPDKSRRAPGVHDCCIFSQIWSTVTAVRPKTVIENFGSHLAKTDVFFWPYIALIQAWKYYSAGVTMGQRSELFFVIAMHCIALCYIVMSCVGFVWKDTFGAAFKQLHAALADASIPRAVSPFYPGHRC